jgi:hypothetical protein
LVAVEGVENAMLAARARRKMLVAEEWSSEVVIIGNRDNINI